MDFTELRIILISTTPYLSALSLARAAGAHAVYEEDVLPLVQECQSLIHQPIYSKDFGPGEDVEDPRKIQIFIPVPMAEEFLRRLGARESLTTEDNRAIQKALNVQAKTEHIKSSIVSLLLNGPIPRSTVSSKLRSIPIEHIKDAVKSLIDDGAVNSYTSRKGERGSEATFYILAQDRRPFEEDNDDSERDIW